MNRTAVAFLSVLVKGPTLKYQSRKSVLVKDPESLVFVQTDKPIYKPGQKGTGNWVGSPSQRRGLFSFSRPPISLNIGSVLGSPGCWEAQGLAEPTANHPHVAAHLMTKPEAWGTRIISATCPAGIAIRLGVCKVSDIVADGCRKSGCDVNSKNPSVPLSLSSVPDRLPGQRLPAPEQEGRAVILTPH